MDDPNSTEKQQQNVNDLVDFMNTSNLLNDYSGEKSYDTKVNESVKETLKETADKNCKLNIYKKYKNKLMLSKWLTDIPYKRKKKFFTSWTMVAIPKGERCLVVGENSTTKVYSKHGFCYDQFQSGIPGGGAEGHGKTILDCIRHPKNKKQFYILDVLYANMMSFCEIEAVVRLNQLEALAEEVVINQKRYSGKKIPHFTVLPHCSCAIEEMTKMMSKPMDFELLGLRFYRNNGQYTRGYTSLVGWLEPWMLPEVLNVPIHEYYKDNKKTDLPLKEYVDNQRKKCNYTPGKWQPLNDFKASEVDGFVVVD